jgi:CDP-glucose 4,6-dehydratase
MTFWSDHRAFVTGATGFVGTHVVRSLVQGGANVICLQRKDASAGAHDVFDLHESVTMVSGNVQDFALMSEILGDYGIESVFHFAGQALVGPAQSFPLSTFETNIQGTYTLLEACRRNPTVQRVVLASTDRAYGTHARLPYTEDHPLSGLFPYDASKACADIIARSYAHSYGIPVVVARTSNIYGPGDTNFSRLIPGTILSVLRDERPVVRSDGTPLRDFVYVDDAVRAYLLLAERITEVAGEAYNLGGNFPISVLDLVNKIIKLAGKESTLAPLIMLQTKVGSEIDALYLSTEKVARRLGWRPVVDLSQGLHQTLNWYRAHMADLVACGQP